MEFHDTQILSIIILVKIFVPICGNNVLKFRFVLNNMLNFLWPTDRTKYIVYCCIYYIFI